MHKTILGTLLIVCTISSCATHPNNIHTSYASPLQYKGRNCEQIAGELDRVSRRRDELYLSLKKTAGTDSAQMAVGMLLFWLALIFLEGGLRT